MLVKRYEIGPYRAIILPCPSLVDLLGVNMWYLLGVEKVTRTLAKTLAWCRWRIRGPGQGPLNLWPPRATGCGGVVGGGGGKFYAFGMLSDGLGFYIPLHILVVVLKHVMYSTKCLFKAMYCFI